MRVIFDDDTNDADDKWKKSELTLRVGIYELAQAVVKQWIYDGKPCNCDIDVWLDLLRVGKETKDKKLDKVNKLNNKLSE